MSSSSKIFLGILTLLPIVLIIIYIGAFFSSFIHVMQLSHQPGENHQPLPEDFFKNMIGLMVLALVAALLSIGLLIYYIIHAVNNKRIDSNERIIWILIFILAGMVGFPVYWFMRIWKTQPVETFH